MSEDRVGLCLSKCEELMGRLSREVHGRLSEQLPPSITMNQFMVCKAIHLRGRATVSELADTMGVSLSAITATADRLCEAGLLRRDRDPGDRRLVWLSLTDKCQGLMDQVLMRWQETLSSYFGRLPLEDLEGLARVVEKLLRIIQTEPEARA